MVAAVTFPSSLPNPSVSGVTPSERRLLSDVTGGPQQARGVQRDYLGTQRLEWSILSAADAATFDTWWRSTLTSGGAWFTSTWPSPQGWVSCVRRFVGAPTWNHLPGGFWRVTAQCQLRGRGLDPQRYSNDRFFSNVVLLCPFSGGANNTPIPTNTSGIDLSSYDHKVKSIGATGGSVNGGYYYTVDPFNLTACTKYGFSVAASNTTGGFYFDQAGPLPEFLMGTGDFTIEMDAAQQIAGSYPGLAFGVGSAGQAGTWAIGTDASSALKLAMYRNGTSVPFIVSSGSVWSSNDAFVNIAYSRVASVGYLFANGVLLATVADTTDYNSLNFQGPGSVSASGISALKGFIANLRWTKGIGRYTANYTPPSAPFPTF